MVCFQTKNPNLGKNCQGLGLENVKIFYGHLEYFINSWDILRLFGTFCVHLVRLFQFWYHAPRKIWQPWFGYYHDLACPFDVAQLHLAHSFVVVVCLNNCCHNCCILLGAAL
jgi:hypothetical protein